MTLERKPTLEELIDIWQGLHPEATALLEYLTELRTLRAADQRREVVITEAKRVNDVLGKLIDEMDVATWKGDDWWHCELLGLLGMAETLGEAISADKRLFAALEILGGSEPAGASLLAEVRQLRRQVQAMRNCGNCADEACFHKGGIMGCLYNSRRDWQYRGEGDA